MFDIGLLADQIESSYSYHGQIRVNQWMIFTGLKFIKFETLDDEISLMYIDIYTIHFGDLFQKCLISIYFVILRLDTLYLLQFKADPESDEIPYHNTF